MYNGKQELINILSHIGFEKLYNVIKNFTELNQNSVKEGIHFPLLCISRYIKWRKNISMN